MDYSIVRNYWLTIRRKEERKKRMEKNIERRKRERKKERERGRKKKFCFNTNHKVNWRCINVFNITMKIKEHL